jgi:hypothetical protein
MAGKKKPVEKWYACIVWEDSGLHEEYKGTTTGFWYRTVGW